MISLLALIFWLCAAAFFWTYFGYPLFMLMRARIAAKPTKQDETLLPNLTLLIPAYNEADVIREKLENAVKLKYTSEKLQILVVDDGSTDGTPEIVREFSDKGVTLLQQPQRGGKMSGVNRGFENATGEIVVLSDASPMYEEDALHKLVRNFADDRVGVVVGALRVWDGANSVAKPAGLYWKYESALRKWESQTGSTVAVHGNMFAVRKTLYRPLKKHTINDEFSIAMEVLRQGFRVIYEPQAISYDMASANMTDEFRRRTRINAGRYQALFTAGYLNAPTADLTFRLISHKLFRPLTPVFMLLAFVCNALLVLFGLFGAPIYGFLTPPLWFWVIGLLAQIAFYGAAYLGYQAEAAGKPNKLLSVPYFFVSSNLAALVGLWRWIRNRQSVTWQKRTTN